MFNIFKKIIIIIGTVLLIAYCVPLTVLASSLLPLPEGTGPNINQNIQREANPGEVVGETVPEGSDKSTSIYEGDNTEETRLSDSQVAVALKGSSSGIIIVGIVVVVLVVILLFSVLRRKGNKSTLH